MSRDYGDVMGSRRGRLSSDAEAHREVLGRVYDIAMQVVELREWRGLTQGELAERCGIDQSDVSRIERGSLDLGVHTLVRIAEALDSEVRLVARTRQQSCPHVGLAGSEREN